MALKLVKKNGIWHIDGRMLGQRVRQSTRLPDTTHYRAIADKERMRVEREIVEGRYGKVSNATFKDACDMYLDWKSMEGRVSKNTIREIDTFLDFWGKVRLNDITPGAIQTYVTNEITGVKPGTVRRKLSVFKAVINHAKKNTEGFAGVDVPMPIVKDARDVHFDEHEANAFLEWVKDEEPYFWPHYVTLIDTGVRLGELLSLRSSHFGTDVLRVRRRLEKSGKTVTRDVPLSDAMLEVRDMMKSKKASEVLFTSSTGLPWSSSANASSILNKRLKRGCDAIGFCLGNDGGMRVHDLRHTFAYLTAKAGADLGDLQYLMGHEDISMTMRYRGFIQSRARVFVRGLRGEQGGQA
jgi:integrase